MAQPRREQHQSDADQHQGTNVDAHSDTDALTVEQVLKSLQAFAERQTYNMGYSAGARDAAQIAIQLIGRLRAAENEEADHGCLKPC